MHDQVGSQEYTYIKALIDIITNVEVIRVDLKAREAGAPEPQLHTTIRHMQITHIQTCSHQGYSHITDCTQ